MLNMATLQIGQKYCCREIGVPGRSMYFIVLRYITGPLGDSGVEVQEYSDGVPVPPTRYGFPQMFGEFDVEPFAGD